MRTMRHFYCILLLFIFAFAAAANAQDDTAPADFDSDLAAEVGADDYGMRSYIFCVLKTGPAKIDDDAKRSELFRGHFSNMGRLAKEGKLVFAGPFGEAEPWRGMFIFNVATIEEAEKLVETDPAVKAGIFEYELKKLYGSAALMKVNEIHSKIQKKKIE